MWVRKERRKGKKFGSEAKENKKLQGVLQAKSQTNSTDVKL